MLSVYGFYILSQIVLTSNIKVFVVNRFLEEQLISKPQELYNRNFIACDLKNYILIELKFELIFEICFNILTLEYIHLALL